MARLMDVADAAAVEMRAWFGREVKDISVHPGPYTENELKRLSTVTPAIHLALLRTHANENAGAVDARDDQVVDLTLAAAQRNVEAEYLASVLARDEGRGRTSERVAEAIATELLRRIPEQRWGAGAVGQAERVAMHNTFTSALAERGIALWAVGWRQKVRLGASVPAGQPPGTLCVSIAGETPVVLHEAVGQ